jgi:antibiotic biosynthesis monooxygenase (ABM) superfamily enzyme
LVRIDTGAAHLLDVGRLPVLGSIGECAQHHAGAHRRLGGRPTGGAGRQVTDRNTLDVEATAPASVPPTGIASAVSCFSRAENQPDFIDWAQHIELAAQTFPGFLQSQLAVTDTALFDWAMAVSFRSEAQLHCWLDSPARTRLLAAGAGRGFPRISTDIVLSDGALPPTGLGVFRHTVAAGRDTEFIALQSDLVELSSGFSGFEGGTLLAPGTTAPTEWLSILRFRTDHQLQAWLNSTERQDALPQLRSQLTEDFSVMTHSTPFGSILRIQDGTTRVTPNWKTAMLVLLVLYPTVMTLSRFLGPLLDDIGAEPWLSMWLSQIVSVVLMTWFFMPAVTGWFRRWLDPVDGAAPRTSLIGAAIVAVVYLATLALFASVNWLQFWDYLD